MSYSTGSTMNQPDYRQRDRQPSRGGRGAIAGQGIFHTEHWKMGERINAFIALQSAIVNPPVVSVGPISLTAPLATVASAGILPLAVEIAGAPNTTVASAGILPKVVEAAIVPRATVASAGILPRAAETTAAPKATVASAGFLPLVREIAAAPRALVSAVGFNPFIPSQIGEKWRNNLWKPLVETLAAKWEGWHRY